MDLSSFLGDYKAQDAIVLPTDSNDIASNIDLDMEIEEEMMEIMINV